MRLLYDNLIYFLQLNGGISSYWYELTSRFLKEEQVFLNFYEPSRKSKNILRQKLQILPSQVITVDTIIPVLQRIARLQHDDTPSIFHSSYFRLPVKSSKTKVVTTVHDFTHEKYYSGPRAWSNHHLKQMALQESDRIIAVSQFTKNDLLNHFPEISEEHVQVIYHGASKDYKCDENCRKHIEAPYFLFVGSREHYKNFEFAIDLTANVKGFELYIVGSVLSKKEQKLLTEKLGNRYQSFRNIDNIQLNVLYNNAFCLLYPSAHEGFGIPLLEAMQAGCPFLALKASSIPEVAGDAGFLMEQLDLDEAISAVHHLEGQREAIINQGLKQAMKFSWDKCFEETFGLYKSLAS